MRAPYKVNYTIKKFCFININKKKYNLHRNYSYSINRCFCTCCRQLSGITFANFFFRISEKLAKRSRVTREYTCTRYNVFYGIHDILISVGTENKQLFQGGRPLVVRALNR